MWLILSGIFAFVITIGLPIAFVLILLPVVQFSVSGNIDLLSILPLKMVSSVSSISMAAIPYFIVAGELLNIGGFTDDLFVLAKLFVGRLRGGLGYVVFIIGGFLGSIMGVAVACCALLSKTLVPNMKKEGYDSDYAAATCSASGVLGPLIPPSTIMVVYGTVTGQSIQALFAAGVIPGILMMIGFMFINFFISRKRGYPKSTPISIREAIRAFIRGIPVFLMPIIILGGILFGIFTPTESATIALWYAFILGIITKRLNFKDLYKSSVSAAHGSANILFLMGTASCLQWTVTMMGVHRSLENWIISLNNVPVIGVISIMLGILLLAGMILDTAAVIMLFAIVMQSIAMGLNLNLVYWGAIFCIAAAIGLITPPVGVNLYTAVSVTNVTFEEISRRIIPFVLASIVVLFIISLLPNMVLWLPQILKLNF